MSSTESFFGKMSSCNRTARRPPSRTIQSGLVVADDAADGVLGGVFPVAMFAALMPLRDAL